MHWLLAKLKRLRILIVTIGQYVVRLLEIHPANLVSLVWMLLVMVAIVGTFVAIVRHQSPGVDSNPLDHVRCYSGGTVIYERTDIDHWKDYPSGAWSFTRQDGQRDVLSGDCLINP